MPPAVPDAVVASCTRVVYRNANANSSTNSSTTTTNSTIRTTSVLCALLPSLGGLPVFVNGSFYADNAAVSPALPLLDVVAVLTDSDATAAAANPLVVFLVDANVSSFEVLFPGVAQPVTITVINLGFFWTCCFCFSLSPPLSLSLSLSLFLSPPLSLSLSLSPSFSVSLLLTHACTLWCVHLYVLSYGCLCVLRRRQQRHRQLHDLLCVLGLRYGAAYQLHPHVLRPLRAAQPIGAIRVLLRSDTHLTSPHLT